jgi:hypothetical protein
MDRFATDVVLPQNEAFYSSVQAFRHSGVQAVSHQAKDKA